MPNWRERAGTVFTCEKHPAKGRRGMVVSNHPLGSAAGMQILAEGGNAIDAAVATLFALSVVEPMMVGIVGGGVAHIRLADGSHSIIDGMSTVPAAGRPDMYRPVPGARPEDFDTIDRENLVGPKAVAVPGALAGWCEALRRFGTLSVSDVLQPAIRLAANGFRVTAYLADCIRDAAADIAADPAMAAVFLRDGKPLPEGARLVRGSFADTLALIARDGPSALYDGPLGDLLVERIQQGNGALTAADLTSYQVMVRAPLRGQYRGWEIIGPPPPSSSGIHILQMLNLLEGWDLGALGFGTATTIHLLAEVMKMGFADRAAAGGDPDFTVIPVERMISKAYADERRPLIDIAKAQEWGPGISAGESANTTHVTVADAHGNVVATTQTINSLFGARFMVPDTGMIPNNYMLNMDPRPGHSLSIAPGKRVTTSMAPMMALHNGMLRYALGLPGGKRIFPSAMQALINLIDHGMTLQEAVEAPRIFDEGPVLETETTVAEIILRDLRARGHQTAMLGQIAGGMNAIEFHPDGSMTGAACWRADGTPIGLAGGMARRGARFSLDPSRA